MHFIRTLFLLIISFGLSCNVDAANNDWLIDYTIQELNKVYDHNVYLDRNGICQGQIYHVDMNYIVYGKYTMGSDHTKMVAELEKANIVSNPAKPNFYVLFTAFYNQYLATNGTQIEINSFEERFKSAIQSKVKLLDGNNSGILFWAASELNNLVLPNATVARPVGNVNNKSGILLGYGLNNETIYNRLVALKPYFYPSSQQTFPLWALNTISNIGKTIQDDSFSAGDVVIAGAGSRSYNPSELVWENRLFNNSNVQAGDPRIWDEAGIMTAEEEQELVQRLTTANKKFKIYTSSSKYTTDIRNLNLQSQSTQGTFNGLEKNAIQRLYEYTGMQNGEIALALHFHQGISTNLLYWDVRIGTQMVDEQIKTFIKNTFIESLFNRAPTEKINEVLYASFTSNNNILLDVPSKVAKIRAYLVNGLSGDEPTFIRNVLSETADKDISALVLELKANNCDLLFDIIGPTDDALFGIWGDNNYGLLMKTLSSLITRNPESVDNFYNASDADIINRTIFWHDNRMSSADYLGKNTYHVSLTPDKEIIYTRDIITIFTRVGPSYSYSGGGSAEGQEMAHSEKFPCSNPIGPLDLVLFYDYSNMSIVSDALIESAELKLVPAIFLKYASDKGFNSDVIGLVGDGLTLIVGPGLIAKAGRAMQIVYCLEMSAAVANIVINVLDIGHEYQDLVDCYNLTMGLIGISNLATTMPGAITASTGVISNTKKATTKKFLAEAARHEAALLNMAQTNVKANEILNLRSTILKEWKRKYPGEVIDANTYKTLGVLSDVTSALVQSLSPTLKNIHNILLSGGVQIFEQGNIIKYITKNGNEFAKIENGVFSVVFTKPNIPYPSSYLDASYIINHINKFKQEGAGFIVIKSWTEGGNPIYNALPPRKFVGLRSDMDAVIKKYREHGNDWTVLRDELNLGINTNLANEEIYYIKISGNDSRFSFDFPNGNEGGAIWGEWVPGGYTKSGTAEAALVGSENIVHNKNMNQLLNNFEGQWERIK